MAYAKAVVDFSKYPDGGLTGPSKEIQDKMLVKNIASFTGAPFTAAAFLAGSGEDRRSLPSWRQRRCQYQPTDCEWPQAAQGEP